MMRLTMNYLCVHVWAALPSKSSITALSLSLSLSLSHTHTYAHTSRLHHSMLPQVHPGSPGGTHGGVSKQTGAAGMACVAARLCCMPQDTRL